MRINIISKIFTLICLCLTFNLFSVFRVEAYDNVEIISHEKVHCQATIDDEFASNRLIVVLTEESSKNVLYNISSYLYFSFSSKMFSCIFS